MEEAQQKRLKEAEDWVSCLINGGKCSKSEHPEPPRLEILIALKFIRMREPHVSTNPVELEHEILKELKRK